MLVVKVGGKKGRDVVLPDLDPPRDVRPLVRFPVPANGVSGAAPGIPMGLLFLASRETAD